MRALFLGLVLLTWSVAAANRPDVVLILADDVRADTIRALGNKEVLTPDLDELVRRGIAFSRAMLRTSKQLSRFDPKTLPYTTATPAPCTSRSFVTSARRPRANRRDGRLGGLR